LRNPGTQNAPDSVEGESIRRRDIANGVLQNSHFIYTFIEDFDSKSRSQQRKCSHSIFGRHQYNKDSEIPWRKNMKTGIIEMRKI